MESFLESFSFLSFLWNMLCCPHHAHTSPQCRGKFPAHHLRLCAGAELSLCLPQNHFMVMSFPFNNLPFPPLHVPKWKSRGKKKKSLNPLHRIWVPVLVLGHFLSLSLFSAWMMLMGRGAGCCCSCGQGRTSSCSLSSICGEGKINHGADVGRKT